MRDTPASLAREMIADVGRLHALGYLVVRLPGCESLREARSCWSVIVAVVTTTAR